jgi:hypothetical protein
LLRQRSSSIYRSKFYIFICGVLAFSLTNYKTRFFEIDGWVQNWAILKPPPARLRIKQKQFQNTNQLSLLPIIKAIYNYDLGYVLKWLLYSRIFLQAWFNKLVFFIKSFISIRLKSGIYFSTNFRCSLFWFLEIKAYNIVNLTKNKGPSSMQMNYLCYMRFKYNKFYS